MKLFGSLKELVSIVFREDGQEISLTPNSSTAYNSSIIIELPNTDANDELVGVAAAQTLQNKSMQMKDSASFFYDESDATKKIAFNAAGNSTGVTLTINSAATTSTSVSFPTMSIGDEIVLKDITQTLSNKTLTTPTINGGDLNGIDTLSLDDTLTAFNLQIESQSASLTADRKLILSLDNADRSISLSGNLSLADSLLTSGAFPITLTSTASTNATLPAGTTTLASTAYADAVDHDNLTNFVENKHIDHSGVSITGGEGISGGGDITASRALALDINGLTNSSTTLGANDLFAFYDATTDTRVEKITFADLEGALNHDNLSGFVSNEHIDWTAATSNFSTTGSGALGSHLEFTETGTPITPGTGRNRVFFSNTDGLPYYVNDAGDVIPFGSGSGGGVKNYVLNPDAEVNHTDSVTATNVTVSAETASPLTGDQSFKLSSATNGGTVDWDLDTIDSFDEGRLLRFKVKTGYVSGTASNWSIGVYETGVGYASEQKTISSGNEQVELQFIPKNGSTYTIKATHATTSTDVILIDDIVLTPEQVVVTDQVYEAPTDMLSEVTVGSFGTAPTLNSAWSHFIKERVGEDVKIAGKLGFSAVPSGTGGALKINLPTYLNPNLSKLSGRLVSGSIYNIIHVGSGIVARENNFAKYSVNTSVFLRTEDSGATWHLIFKFTDIGGTNGASDVIVDSSIGNPFNWRTTPLEDDGITFNVSWPVAEWAGTSTFGANNRVQYLHNFDTATGADDTADFGYGSGGQSIVAISSTNADVKKRVRSQVDVQDSFKISLQVSPGNNKWFNANEIFPYMSDGSAKYGMRIENVSGTTDMDVVFGGDGAAQGDAWSNYTSWKWRVLISQNPLGIGAGLHDSVTSGAISPDAQTIYGAKTFDSSIGLRDGSGVNSWALQAPTSLTANTTLTLPDGVGTNGQVLTTNGVDTLSWTSPKINKIQTKTTGSTYTTTTASVITFNGIVADKIYRLSVRATRMFRTTINGTAIMNASYNGSNLWPIGVGFTDSGSYAESVDGEAGTFSETYFTGVSGVSSLAINLTIVNGSVNGLSATLEELNTYEVTTDFT